MLIVCNGAIKSGSTWLYNVLVNLVSCDRPPSRYLTNRSEKSPCIRPEMLQEFLEHEDIRSRSFITKNHLAKESQRDLLLSYEDVFVFDIERDVKDVVVSNYYHDCFRHGYGGTFREFYWGRGRKLVAELARYHRVWKNCGPSVYTSSYERLHLDFHDEVLRIAGVLGIAPGDVDPERIKEATSIGRLRAQYRDDPKYQGEKFFRKGEIGDWKNHFDDVLLRDVVRLERYGLSRLDVLGRVQRCRLALQNLGRRPQAS